MKSVVFDMDGILFDTERVCENSWIKVAQENGLPDMEIIFPKCIGRNENGSKEVVMEAYGPDFDYATFRKQASVRFWEEIEENGLPIKPGVKEILAWLKENGWKIGLASSTKKTSILSHLEQAGIAEYFSAVISGEMVTYSKPKPDIYLLACEELGVNPTETFAIEDSFNGIRAAHAAGMHPIMVPDMLPPDEEMEQLSEKIFTDLFEVMEYFKQQ